MLRQTIACLLAAALVAAVSLSAKGAERRSVATVAWAIGVDHGHLPLVVRQSYARALVKAAKKNDLDAFTLISIIWHESGFRAGAVGDGGEAIGLGQIHYRNLCASRPESCATARMQLFDPVYNITTVAGVLAAKRKWCREQTGRRVLLPNLLHAYGYNQRKNLKCNRRKTKKGWMNERTPPEMARIIRYRHKLINKLSQRNSKQRR